MSRNLQSSLLTGNIFIFNSKVLYHYCNCHCNYFSVIFLFYSAILLHKNYSRDYKIPTVGKFPKFLSYNKAFEFIFSITGKHFPYSSALKLNTCGIFPLHPFTFAYRSLQSCARDSSPSRMSSITRPPSASRSSNAFSYCPSL